MDAVQISTPQGVAGRVVRDGTYLFTFDALASIRSAPALSMPFRVRPYEHKVLHPIFQMNLPEGFVLEQLRLRLAKTTGMDPLLLLATIGADDPIGRLRFALAAGGSIKGNDEASPRGHKPTGERLAELLASKGSKDLFARLVDTYLLRSGLSGVQPKVMVPEALPEPGLQHPGLRASMAISDLIVKSGLGEYPGLAINEFVCMSIVKQCGITVPEFFLSDDGALFIMRRFDRPASGEILGFEDMLVLAGRSPEQKYQGSYEMVLRLLGMYCTPQSLPAARQQLFDMVALSCILGNGDAHMKNFGVLYPSIVGPVTMAPAFDIVCTSYYLPEDSLALELAGNKSFFAARLGLLDFGAHCGFTKGFAKARVEELASITLNALQALAPIADKLPGLRTTLEQQASKFLPR